MDNINLTDENNLDNPVFVDYEYGDLKEVIVGIDSGLSPSKAVKWFKNALKILPKDEAEYAMKTAGKLWSKLKNPETKKSEAQMLAEENESLIGVLEKFNIKVKRPTKLTEDSIKKMYGKNVLKHGFSQDFPRDNIVVIGNNVIELNLRTPIRKVDISGFERIFKEKCYNSGVKWFSMPHTPLLNEYFEDTPCLEGGDVMVFGETVLVGNSENTSVGSNELGYKWLKNVIGEEYNVIRVPMIESILHLDCILSVPRDGLAIICEEGFVGGIPEYIRDWDLIKVSLDDAKRLSVNGLPINTQNYIISYNDFNSNDFVKSELEKRGITVWPVYFPTHNGQGGSIRCATQPLLRKLP